jgi:DNA polymerase-3 subunit alpha
MSYSNLHHKTHFSCGISIGKSSEIISQAKNLGLESIAITDYGTIGGVWDFIKEGKKQDFPIMIGAELNVYWEQSQNYQIVLLVKDQTGYHNLCRILSFAYNNSHIFKEPTCSIADLDHFRAGLVCLSGGVKGIFAKDFLDYDSKRAITMSNNKASELSHIFKDDFYLEYVLSNPSVQWNEEKKDYIQNGRETIREEINSAIYSCGRSRGIKRLLTCDSDIPKAEDKPLQDVIVRNSKRGQEGFYVRESKPIMSGQEITSRAHLVGIHHNETRNALDTTLEVSKKCQNPNLSFSEQLVDFPIITHPLHKQGMNKLELIDAIIKDYGRMPSDNLEYSKRLSYELDVICHNGKINLIDYFLVLEDLCRWCRENGIIVGPGRGSGAGSLLNYVLQITHLDPMTYGLLFERFISEARILKGTYPDVDLDFSDQKRAKQYLYERYGEDKVKPIATFQTMKTKTAIKDAFKLFYPGVEYSKINALTTSFPKKEELESEVEYYERSLEESPEINIILNSNYPNVGKTIERMIGFNRQVGVHPCGIAITKDPISELAPVRFVRGREYLDFNLDSCEEIGIIKFDILSLTTLKYMDTATKQIKERLGIDIDIYNIPLDDKATLENFSKGDTASVFQFNSDVAISILTQIKVETLDDLCMTTSAGRPGPMKNKQHLEFIKRKNGDNKSIPPHHALQESLEETYGIMMYQESVMKASQILGGFSLSEADDIRKGMGKKKRKVLQPYKVRFIDYASKNYEDIDEEKAAEIWNLMETFAGYGFNKSHSMAYAYIGYVCQYLKTHYPLEWWFSCLTHSIDKSEKFNTYFQSAKEYILTININESKDDFFINSYGKIVFPFSVVKGIGEKANEEINAKRPYSSFEDFSKRTVKRVINKRVVEKLIWAGAFDIFGVDKKELIQQYYTIRKEKLPEEYLHIDRAKEVLLQQKSLDFLLIDYYDLFKEIFTEDNLIKLSEMEGLANKRSITIGGKLGKITRAKTKRKETYATFTIENYGTEIKVKAWPEELANYNKSLKEGEIVKLKGQINYWQGQPQVILTHAWSLSEALAIANQRRKNGNDS